VPQLLKQDKRSWWILDDTAHAKKGTHSVGVARQYCGRLGKTDNCQVAVSLSLANGAGSVPLAYRLYLPKAWREDAQRRARAGVPEALAFQTKGKLARAQIQAALAADIPRGIVLADAAYGDAADFREWLIERELDYVLGVRMTTRVGWDNHQPLSVLALARALTAKRWRTVTWRQGVHGALSSRFARVRIRAGHGHRARAEQWLLIEWPAGQAEPTHYWLSTLPENISCKALVAHVKGRWMIERDYEELKSELGLSHYEGRNWRGFHHHATLCIAAYGFLMLERLRGFKKNAARFKTPPLPKDFRPRGSGADAASHALVDRHRTLSPRPRHRASAATVPVLRKTSHQTSGELLTQ
jgi:SRSO17 transposase